MPNNSQLIKFIHSHRRKILFTICVSFFPVWYFSSSLLVTLHTLLIIISVILFAWFYNTNMTLSIAHLVAKVFPKAIKPVWDTKCEPYNSAFAALFRANYQVMHEEFLEYEKHGYLPQFYDVYPGIPGAGILNYQSKWRTVTLRCYGKDNRVAKFFPKTMEIVNKSSIWLTHIMFSCIEPYKFMPRHRGPYCGVFRYELGLEIPPNVRDPEKDLYLAVWPGTASTTWWNPNNVPEGKPHIIGLDNGSDCLFDDICVHEMINNTPHRNIILFVDVERQDMPFFSKLIHRFLMYIAGYLPTIKKSAWKQDRFLDATEDKVAEMKFESQSSSQRWYRILNTVEPFMLPLFLATEQETPLYIRSKCKHDYIVEPKVSSKENWPLLLKLWVNMKNYGYHPNVGYAFYSSDADIMDILGFKSMVVQGYKAEKYKICLNNHYCNIYQNATNTLHEIIEIISINICKIILDFINKNDIIYMLQKQYLMYMSLTNLFDCYWNLFGAKYNFIHRIDDISLNEYIKLKNDEQCWFTKISFNDFKSFEKQEEFKLGETKKYTQFNNKLRISEIKETSQILIDILQILNKAGGEFSFHCEVLHIALNRENHHAKGTSTVFRIGNKSINDTLYAFNTQYEPFDHEVEL